MIDDREEVTFTDLFEQLIAANHLGGGLLDWEFGDAEPLSVQGGSRQKAVVGKMLLQQLIDLATESDIPSAGCLQVSRARLRRAHLQGFQKNFTFRHNPTL